MSFFFTRGTVALIAALLFPALAIAGAPAGDVLPFRLVYGNPRIAETAPASETACYLWSEGGRLHLRITSDGKPHEVEGELRTSSGGSLRDVTPVSENLRVRQPVPSVLLFDVEIAEGQEGLDVVLGGDVTELVIDLKIDRQARPDALRIGERQDRPQALPAELDISGAEASWIERFGFR